MTRIFRFLLNFDEDVRLDFVFSSPFIHIQFLQLCQVYFSYICYVPYFRSFTDGNCLYIAISVRVVSNNLLIYLLRILTSPELFLNHEFYSRFPVLTDMYNSGKTVLEEIFLHSMNQRFN